VKPSGSAESVNAGRRTFLKVSTAAAGGLLIGFRLPFSDVEAAAGDFTPNAWIHIGSDDAVTLQVANSEMGQGVFTSIPMLLAEELDCDWSRIRVEMAPVGKAYVNPIIGMQATGGSTAIRAFYLPLRQAGAVARELLVRAAARHWDVQESECRAENGTVIHVASERRVQYGQIASDAAKLPPPGEAFLKEPSEFRLIGKAMPRLDTPVKVSGSAVFGIDVKLPGLLTAVVARSPVFGGKLKSFDDTKAPSGRPGRAARRWR